MGLLDFLGGDVVKTVANVVDDFLNKDEHKEKLELQARQLDIEEEKIQAQILEKVHETNIAEAKSSNWFVASWRPFVGWVCGVALAYTFILEPIIEWGVKIAGINVSPPTLNTGALFNLVLAMLGFGGLRTFEKYKGVHNRH